MLISLYTVRVVLTTLGIEDYGIQNVVAGFVSMFSFVTGSLSVAISRFMTINIGEKRTDSELNCIFSSSIISMIFLSIILLLFIEIVGLYFLYNRLNIPIDRFDAAFWTLQFSILTLLIQMLSIPFDALIVSNEKMEAYAYISLADGIIKLLIAFLLYISPIDKLIFYSLLLFLEAGIIRVLYGYYCKRNFKEIRFRWFFDRLLVKKMLILSGWDFWGSASYILKNYGVNILINIFNGPVVNAARGIAMQVNTALSKFSGSFLIALRPQIIKAYAAKDFEYLIALIDNGTKFATYLFVYLSMPVILECDYILTIWLKEIPQYTVHFVVLIIILSISEGSLIYAHNTALVATGRIKKSQLITGTVQLLNIPISCLLLAKGYSPISTVLIAILLAHVCCFIRVYILKDLISYSVSNFFQSIYLKLIFVSALSFVLPYLLTLVMKESLIRLICVSFSSLLWSAIVILYVGCTKQERSLILNKVSLLVKRYI